jgi:PAS domain-containing protein
MPLTSALPPPGAAAAPLFPSGSSTPPAEPRTAHLAGRFRGDLTTGQWWWSPELHGLLGLRAGAGRPSVQLLLAHVHEDDRPAVREALAASGVAGSPFAREHRLRRADGVQRRALLVCEPEVDPTGAVLALSGMVLDVTDGRPTGPDPEQLRHLETEVEQLRSAMASRASIEQAKGILMLLMSCGDQVAFDLLAHISSHTHRKVRDVAVAIVDSASGRTPLPDDVRSILHDATPPSRPTV